MPDKPDGATASELTPLALLLEEMRVRWRNDDKEGAIALARIAAPYLHSRRRAAIPPTDLTTIPDADLDKLRSAE